MTDRTGVPGTIEPTATRRRRTPPWLFETLIILASVLAGYVAASFGQYRDDRELENQALEALTGEVEHNRGQLEPMLSVHSEWVRALLDAQRTDGDSADEAALDVWFATRPTLPEDAASSFPRLRRSAWDAAFSSGALRLIDYDVATALADIYRVQEIATDNVDRLAHGALSDVAIYDPASRTAALRLLWLTLADIHSAENLLLDLYDQHLPMLRELTESKPVAAVRGGSHEPMDSDARDGDPARAGRPR